MSLSSDGPLPRGELTALVLLGTVHCEPDGFSKSLLFFERYKPDLILVEISDFALKFRQEHSSELRDLVLARLRFVSQKRGIDFEIALAHAQIASILRQISFPFEYSASSAYARRTGTPLVAVDYSGFSRKWIKTWPEMISAGNIEILMGLQESSCFLLDRAGEGLGRSEGQKRGELCPPAPPRGLN